MWPAPGGALQSLAPAVPAGAQVGGLRPALRPGSVTQDALAAAAAAAQAAVFAAPAAAGKRQPQQPVGLMQAMTPGPQTAPPTRPLSECLQEAYNQAAAGDGRAPMKWKPLALTDGTAAGNGRASGAGAVAGPELLQRAELELWKFTAHCADQAVPDAQLQKELEALLQLRARMMGMSGMEAATPPQLLVHLIATALAEGGSHMFLADLMESPGLAEVKGGLPGDVAEFLAKHAELFAVLDEPLGKTVTLIGDVPPAPAPAPAGPPAKRPRMIEAAPAVPAVFDPEKAAQAVAKIVERVKEMLLQTEGGALILDQLGSDETIRDLKKDCSKTKKMSQVLKEHGFDLSEGPRSEDCPHQCIWVRSK